MNPADFLALISGTTLILGLIQVIFAILTPLVSPLPAESKRHIQANFALIGVACALLALAAIDFSRYLYK